MQEKTTSSDDKYGVLFGESGLLKITALAYAAGQASKVPEGRKLVPVEPSNEMISHLADVIDDPSNERSSWDLAENIYRAMLAAAPSQEQ